MRFHSGANHRPFVGCDKCEISVTTYGAAPWLAEQLALARAECRAQRALLDVVGAPHRDLWGHALHERRCAYRDARAANQMENT